MLLLLTWRQLKLLPTGKRQYLRPLVCYRDRVFGMGRGLAVECDNRPFVLKRTGLMRAYIQHRFDGKTVTRTNAFLRSRPAVIGYLRRLVHLPPYAMAGIITHDAVPKLFCMLLYRETDIAEPIVGPAGIDAQLKALVSYPDKLFEFI